MALQREKMTFTNSEGVSLAGLLETPEGPAHGYVLFAHGFTLGKDITSASRISKALVDQGFAVFRFDFTGLGGSDGDFSNTNFSTNVRDLSDAADHLRQHYQAPVLLIGHSLGGAAMISAAHRIPESKAVVTIGAPASPAHVSRQFGCDIEKIARHGEASVSLGGRHFVIRQQFLEDIQNHKLCQALASLRKALLVFHSPMDEMVPIAEAAEIYSAAKHPKSFITLGNADHLLSRREDASYVAQVIAAWVSRYL